VRLKHGCIVASASLRASWFVSLQHLTLAVGYRDSVSISRCNPCCQTCTARIHLQRVAARNFATCVYLTLLISRTTTGDLHVNTHIHTRTAVQGSV
jgi:hypothetical protein